MNISKLIFFPKATKTQPDNQLLINTLIKSAFIDSKKYSHNHYLPGNNFLSLITFLGCSPNINLMPVDGENHCFISIIETTLETECLGFTQTVNPKCPSCKKRINDWKISDWQQSGKTCICDKCKTETLYAELNWKNECGFACGGFEINHIYPHEAVPTDQFLEKLNTYSGFEWDYCYTSN